MIRQLDTDVSPAAIAVALRLAERGVRRCGERGLWVSVYSKDAARTVRFTALPRGEVRVTHTVARWTAGRHHQPERWGTERNTILPAGDPRAARALAIIHALPPAGPDSHGS